MLKIIHASGGQFGMNALVRRTERPRIVIRRNGTKSSANHRDFALMWLTGLLVMTLVSSSVGAPTRWHWRNPQPEPNTFTGVAYGNGTFVTVSYTGTILTSTDGAGWITRDVPTNAYLTAVIFAEQQFVAVGSAILLSSNGLDWTVHQSPTTNRLNAIAFAAGQFVAVGDWETIATSPDAQHWTVTTSTNWNSLTSVAYGKNTFVAVGSFPGCLTSTDGTNWEAQTWDFGGGFSGVAFGEGQFVAVGGSFRAAYDFASAIATSPDGVHWTSREPNSFGILCGIVHGDHLFVAVGGYSIFGDLHQTVLDSPDGIHWTDRHSNDHGNPLLFAVTYANETYVAVGALGVTRRSNDGVHWQSDYSITRAGLNAIANGNGVAVAVGDMTSDGPDSLARATILRSTDGLQWTRGVSDIEVPLVGVTFGNGMFIAVGETYDSVTNYGVALSSNDGLTWNLCLLLEGGWLRAVCWGNGLFVTVGDEGTVVTSSDGFNWARESIPQITGLNNIAYANGRFVATCFENQILCSTNGTNWTIVQAPGDRSINGVAGGNGLFVIVAGDHTLVSTNGLDWSVHNLNDSVPEAAWSTGLGYANNQFFATDRNALYTSSDGVNWSPEHVSLSDLWVGGAAFTAFTAHKNTIIGVGTCGLILQSEPNTDTPPSVVLSSINNDVVIGEPSSFIALAQGTPPLQFQWLRDGKPIPGATNLVLTLQPITPHDAGEYSLAATNAAGTAISPPASLTVRSVPIGPVTLSLAWNAFSEVVVTAPRGTKCQIESTAALGPLAVWNPGRTFTAGSSAFSWFDPASVDARQRFYRVAYGPGKLLR
jgi:hypothetical protein